MRHLTWIVISIGVSLSAIALGDTKIGNMTVRQAFPDERVARLVTAVVDADFDEANQQIKVGADVNYIGTDGITPLIWVMIQARRDNDLDGLEFMLERGANPN